ncbi:MAG: ABC-F type ribosomal protection protein [Firmicutes bacterium]|nr:ABC-F type ribosomal protection protein [Bacillota bacterium]
MQYKIINGAISFGDKTVLEEINFEINDHDKIAIVGRNGSGKTSLLKSLLDNEMLETGLGEDNLQIIKSNNPVIGYQMQEAFTNLNVTLSDEILKVYAPLVNLQKKIEKLEKKLEQENNDEILESYLKAIDQYKVLGGYSYQKEYETALLKFGFTKEDKQKLLADFSGGQRTKISFLKLLLSKPDILLLDEPTNHLDIKGIEWLEKYLSNYPKAIVVVSHDRMFLDKIVNKVYEIEYSSLTKYKGNYSSYEKQKKMNYEKQLSDYEYQQKEIKRLKDIAQRFKYKPSKASMAMSKLKKIQQMQIVEKPQKADSKKFKGQIKIKEESSNNVLSVKELAIGYNNTILSKGSFELFKGQKVGVIGENGKGKSTLLKTLMGIIPKISGKYSYGFNVKTAYFDQQMEFLDDENTVYDELIQSIKETDPLTIRKLLGAFLFTGDDIFKKIKILSGGEKVRLSLCKILYSQPNFLLLDEPTNHLDIIGKETLEEILKNYEGTILFVSHDRYFINKLADSLLVFEDNIIKPFNGTYSEYIIKTNEKDSLQKNVNMPKVKNSKVDNPKNIKVMIKKVEKEISALEKEIGNIQKLMLEKDNYTDYQKINDLQKQLKNNEDLLASKMQDWENLSNSI